MKIQTTIISFLLIAGITTRSAQNAYNAYNSYFKASGGFTDAQGKGSLHTLLNSTEDLQTTSSGLDLELDSSFIFSLEGGFYSAENFSFGFEYTAVNADAEASKALAGGTGDIGRIKTGLGLTAIDGGFFVGKNSFEEKIDSDRFMFVMNYEYAFNNEITLLVNGGLGIMNVEQKIKYTADNGTVVTTLIDSSEDKTVFAYQIGIGLGYTFNDAYTLYGGARYLAASDIDFKYEGLDLKKYNPDVLAYELGLRYSF